MDSELERLEELFWQASQLESETERLAFLDKACGANEHLRARVVRLLNNRTAADEMAQAFQPTLALARDDMTDRTIGPYKLREKIGEGGMGVVYAADQKAPVKRRVALKVIKPGMDSRQVIARFESERQTLALMDHPNIARVLDAGTTDRGLPFFVMELVNGMPITRYCDEHRLTIRQRLELMVPICRAVQHAHQKGIIHRDLKPSNILVAQYDGKPVPKVIDFGVAKAVGSLLGDYSVYTEFGMLVGTLEYMSPEQAQRNQLDIDTRSDVYSLGVVLYELLAGATPFDGKRLRTAAFDEMLRIIRDEEAPRPSFKLSTSRALPDVASSRSVSPDRLSKVVRGELDWIVMKALEKDRNRRYESSLMLGQDLERFLNSEAVLASPPSLNYRTKKFLYRNRRSFAFGAVLTVAVSLGAASLGWVAWQDAKANRINTERLSRLNDSVNAAEEVGDWNAALTLIEQELGQDTKIDNNENTNELLAIRKRQIQLYQALENARLLSSERRANSVITVLEVDSAYRDAFAMLHVNPEEDPVEQTVDRLKRRVRNMAPISEALTDWANLKKAKMDSMPPQSLESFEASSQFDPREGSTPREQVIEQCQQLLAIADALDPDSFRTELRSLLLADSDEARFLGLISSPSFDQQSISTKLLFARIMNKAGGHREALTVVRKIQHEYPGDFWCNYELAELLRGRVDLHDSREALPFYTAAVALRPDNTGALSGLAETLFELGEFQDAKHWLDKLVSMDSSLSREWSLLGDVHRALEQGDDAKAAYHEALECDPNHAGAWYKIALINLDEADETAAIDALENALAISPRYPAASNQLIELYTAQKQIDKAESTYRRAVAAFPEWPYFYNSYGVWLLKQGRHDEAIDVLRQGLLLTSDHDMRGLCNLAMNLGMTLRYRAPQEEAREIEAIEAFRKCVEIDPEWGPGHDQLSRVLSTSRYEQLRDPEQAILHGKRAVDLAIASRGSAGAYELATLGMAHYRAGNWQACLDTLSSPNVRPDSASAPTDLFIAMATWHAGDQEKAKQLFSQAVERISQSEWPSSRDREALAEAKELVKENAEVGKAKSDLEPAEGDSVSRSPGGGS